MHNYCSKTLKCTVRVFHTEWQPSHSYPRKINTNSLHDHTSEMSRKEVSLPKCFYNEMHKVEQSIKK